MTIMQLRRLPYRERSELAARIPAGKLRQAYILMFDHKPGRYYKQQTWRKCARLCGIDEEELRTSLTAIIKTFSTPVCRNIKNWKGGNM